MVAPGIRHVLLSSFKDVSIWKKTRLVLQYIGALVAHFNLGVLPLVSRKEGEKGPGGNPASLDWNPSARTHSISRRRNFLRHPAFHHPV